MGHDRLLVWEGQKGTKQGRGVMVQCSQGRHHHRAWRVQPLPSVMAKHCEVCFKFVQKGVVAPCDWCQFKYGF